MEYSMYTLRKFIYDCWNHVMNSEVNPLRHIPDMQVRHMVMQVLAFMWSAVFAIMIAESVWAFGVSALAHVLLVAATVITVATFKVAEHKPWLFGTYHSYGRGRGYVIYRDKNGNPYRVPLDKNDPGGEHE